MSLTLSSAHVHTTFCDGKTPAPEMAKAAFEKGFVSLGFSSHAPRLRFTSSGLVNSRSNTNVVMRNPFLTLSFLMQNDNTKIIRIQTNGESKYCSIFDSVKNIL